MPALTRWIRVPSLRARDVPRAWIREGRYYPCRFCYRRGLPCVRPWLILQCAIADDARKFRPWLFWIYGERIRKASRYAK